MKQKRGFYNLNLTVLEDEKPVLRHHIEGWVVSWRVYIFCFSPLIKPVASNHEMLL